MVDQSVAERLASNSAFALELEGVGRQFGVLVALFPLLISLAAPNLLDHLPGAFRLVEDVARDPSMQPTPGGMPETKSHRELKETRRNQHRLEKVQLIRRDRE